MICLLKDSFLLNKSKLHNFLITKYFHSNEPVFLIERYNMVLKKLKKMYRMMWYPLRYCRQRKLDGT